jgi:hypothetical protein
MKTALFTNFTNQEFVGYWNGKGRKYPAGASEYMPDYLAKHFAKHLTNRELLRTKPDGTLVYKDGEKMTSPKNPEQVPMFMDLFSKAYTPDDIEDLGGEGDALDALIGAANKNRQERIARVEANNEKVTTAPPLSTPRQPKPQEDENFKRETSGAGPTGAQTVLPPDWNESDDESKS